jgi:hypothetical protein
MPIFEILDDLLKYCFVFLFNIISKSLVTLLNYDRFPYDQIQSPIFTSYPIPILNVRIIPCIFATYIHLSSSTLFYVYFFIHNVLNLYSIRRLCIFQIFSVLGLCCKCVDLHPRGEAVRRSSVSNVLEDIANTENMDFWMKEGLEELEEVRTGKSNLVTISKRIAEA